VKTWAIACLLLVACESGGDAADDDAGPQPHEAARAESKSYQAVREILTHSCTYERCHSGVPIGGNLDLTPGIDYAGSMVGVPSCEYPKYLRVAPGDPEHSWVMIKLTSQVRPRQDALADYILFEPDTGWDESKRICRDHTPDGTPLFGQRMPLTAPNMLPQGQIETIREWIAEGAPH
jgi:hypothetical protein